MIKHIVKLLWTKKRNNFLLLVEIFFSFLILFTIFSLLISSFKKYNSPLGYDYKNIFRVQVSREDSLSITLLQKEIESLTEVETLCNDKWNSGPYNNNDVFTPMSFINVPKDIKHVRYTYVDDNFADVFRFKLSEGRWFNEEDNGAPYEPVVINGSLKNELFGNESAAGKILKPKEKDVTRSNRNLKVVGVVENYRTQGEFGTESDFMFFRVISNREFEFSSSMFIRTKYNVSVNFEKKLAEVISSLNPASKIEVERFETIRKKYLASDIRQMIVFSTFGVFLVINVVLGLSGILWFNICSRRKEIGLRRAMGADRKKIFILITGEVLVLTTISILCGCLFTIQYPAVDLFSVSSGMNYLALLAAIIFIYLVISLCSLYPGYLASTIEPVAALHED